MSRRNRTPAEAAREISLHTKMEVVAALSTLGLSEGDLLQLADLARAKAEACADAAQGFEEMEGTAKDDPLVLAIKESEAQWNVLVEKVEALGGLLR